MRDRNVDMLRGISIFIIVWSHISLGVLLDEIVNTTILSLFFILSGKFYRDMPLRELVSRAYKSLLIPFALFTVVGYTFNLAYCLLIDGRSFRYEMFFSDLITGADYEANIPLWFLISLFEVQVIVNILAHTIRNYKKQLMIAITCMIAGCMALHSGINCLYMGKSLLYLSSFMFGISFKKLPSQRSIFSVSGAALSVTFLVLKIYFIRGCADYILGIMASFLLFPCLRSIHYATDTICWLGRNSLVILCMHIMTNNIVWRLAYPYFKEPGLVLSFFYAILSVLMCIPIVYIYNNYIRQHTR